MLNSPFATVEDYTKRFGEFEDEDLLKEVLMDATRFIATKLERKGFDPSDPDKADLYMQVCRSVTNRCLDRGPDNTIPNGVTQMTQTSGPFSKSYTVSNAYGDMYLTKAEKDLLGLNGSRIHFICPGGCDE